MLRLLWCEPFFPTRLNIQTEARNPRVSKWVSLNINSFCDKKTCSTLSRKCKIVKGNVKRLFQIYDHTPKTDYDCIKGMISILNLRIRKLAQLPDTKVYLDIQYIFTKKRFYRFKFRSLLPSGDSRGIDGFNQINQTPRNQLSINCYRVWEREWACVRER